MIKVNDRVTCKESIEAYYSNYGINPTCYFTNKDVGIVKELKVPYVSRSGTFTCVDFEKNGQTWRVALDNKNIVKL